ncbi:MAG: TRAP transporter small permease subunit [Trueperaceae bacterium]
MRLFRTVERALLVITQAIALLGGAVLITLTLITVYSVVGRAVSRNFGDWPLLSWWGPLRGDFELIEMGTAIAIFAFLPYTQMVRGNVLVDFFTARASPRAKAGLAIPANLLFSALAILISWRMIIGTFEQLTSSFNQTTMLLRLPLWWGYMPATFFICLLALVCFFTVWRSSREAFGDGEPVSS